MEAALILIGGLLQVAGAGLVMWDVRDTRRLLAAYAESTTRADAVQGDRAQRADARPEDGWISHLKDREEALSSAINTAFGARGRRLRALAAALIILGLVAATVGSVLSLSDDESDPGALVEASAA